MPKTIASQLITAKSKSVALTSRLIRIGPLVDGSFIRWTSIDKDELYDFGGSICADGLGVQTYYAATGLQMTTIEANNDLSVNNAEAQSLMPVYPMPGITEEMVITGKLDTIPYVVIEHDCVNGAAGEHEIMASGVLGNCRIEQGLVVIPELVSWSQLLNQTGIISQTSIDCRSKQFGSQPGDEREYCGFDLTGEWIPFTVTSIGTETVREFYVVGLSQPDDWFAPGLVTWDTGDNAGFSQEVEAFFEASTGSDAYISLRFTTRKPIQAGDTGQVRRDCTRKWEGHNSCQTYFATLRGEHFRGEPLINIGDTVANRIPGVNSTTSTGGTGEAV
jgi:hypothetical protein